MKHTLLSDSFTKENHSIIFTRLVQIDKRKVRIVVERNAYDFQSRAVASIWTGDGWNFVWSLPREDMTVLSRKQGPHGRIPVVNYTSDKITQYRDLFEEDARKLEVHVGTILS